MHSLLPKTAQWPPTLVWTPLAAWYGGYAGASAGATGITLGWIAGCLLGNYFKNWVAQRGMQSRTFARCLPGIGVILFFLAHQLSFPVATALGDIVANFLMTWAAWMTILVVTAMLFFAAGLAITTSSLVWPRLGLASELCIGSFFTLVPLTAHRQGELIYPYWLADTLSLYGLPLHAGYFIVGSFFAISLVLRLRISASPLRHRIGAVPSAVAILLFFLIGFVSFWHLRLPLNASAPLPPSSAPQQGLPVEDESPKPTPPDEDHYEALIRFRGLPPESPTVWGGDLFRFEASPWVNEPPSDGRLAHTDVYFFGVTDAPPIYPTAVLIEPLPSPPGCTAAYHAISKLPSQGFDPALLTLYRITDRIKMIPPEQLPDGWRWLVDEIVGMGIHENPPPDSLISMTSKWLTANTHIDPGSQGSLLALTKQLNERSLPLKGNAGQMLELGVAILRSKGISARIAHGYRYPPKKRGPGDSDLLLFASMRTSWLEVDFGGHGWVPLMISLPDSSQSQSPKPDPEMLQQVLELLRREKPAESTWIAPNRIWPWLVVLLCMATVLWKTGQVLIYYWIEPLRPALIPGAGPTARCLELLTRTAIFRRQSGETLKDFADRLGKAHPDLGARMLLLITEQETAYAALRDSSLPAAPSSRLRAAYATILARIAKMRPWKAFRTVIQQPRPLLNPTTSNSWTPHLP